MSPESGRGTATILAESARVRDLLLERRAKFELSTEPAWIAEVDGVRQQLGYDQADTRLGDNLIDRRTIGTTAVITPGTLAQVLPLSPKSVETTRKCRDASAEILRRQDDRLIVVVGPCSIHDPEAALEYADNVKRFRQKYKNDLELIMRAYMEKPRTELGWKGLIYDPRLDGSDDINLGVVSSRMLSCQITDKGVPIAMERLNALTPQYFNALVAYDAIGARNTTDQKAREYGSGTSSPIGFKNTPEGSILAAAQAVVSANGPHAFLGMSMNGQPMQVNTSGNDLAHIILRGDDKGPNYSIEHVAKTKKVLRSKGLLEVFGIDMSHRNSVDNKNIPTAIKQFEVALNVSEQIALGELAIGMVMIESNLIAGNQKLDPAKETKLKYGQSITDECIDLEQTEGVLDILSNAVQARRKSQRV